MSQKTNELAALRRRSEELQAANEWGERAIEVNEELLELDPRAVVIHNRLAKCFRLAGDYRAARTLYEAVLELETEGPAANLARVSLASVTERRDAEDEAERVAQETEAEVGDVTDPLEARARASVAKKRGQLDLAVQFFRRAADLWGRPDETLSDLSSLGSTLRLMKQPGDALAVADEAIAILPSRRSNKMNYTVRIAALADLGRLGAADTEGELLLHENPSDAYVLNGVGRVYALRQRFDDAERCFFAAAQIGGRPRSDAVRQLKGLIPLRRAFGEHEAADRLERVVAELEGS